MHAAAGAAPPRPRQGRRLARWSRPCPRPPRRPARPRAARRAPGRARARPGARRRGARRAAAAARRRPPCPAAAAAAALGYLSVTPGMQTRRAACVSKRARPAAAQPIRGPCAIRSTAAQARARAWAAGAHPGAQHRARLHEQAQRLIAQAAAARCRPARRLSALDSLGPHRARGRSPRRTRRRALPRPRPWPQPFTQQRARRHARQLCRKQRGGGRAAARRPDQAARQGQRLAQRRGRQRRRPAGRRVGQRTHARARAGRLAVPGHDRRDQPRGGAGQRGPRRPPVL
jgi:hypothetical protein